jgi:hypothetical protein
MSKRDYKIEDKYCIALFLDYIEYTAQRREDEIHKDGQIGTGAEWETKITDRVVSMMNHTD